MQKGEKMKITQKITYSALFMALGIILPFFTGQLQQFGNMLLPMHLPVFLCSFICGWKYGLLVGLILPIFRSALFSMPVMYPNAIGMSVELATYGFVAGFLYEKRPWKCLKSLYISLISAMILGRVAWGIAQIILLGLNGKAFTWQLFLAGALSNAVLGIVIQLILIPALMLSLHRTNFHKLKSKKETSGYEHK